MPTSKRLYGNHLAILAPLAAGVLVVGLVLAFFQAPIEADCDCETCAGGFSRAYLRHLFSAGEMLGPTLVSLHNVRLYQRLMLYIRRSIERGAWSGLIHDWPCLGQGNEDTLGETA